MYDNLHIEHDDYKDYYDIGLLKRLIPYLRPYIILIIVTSLFIVIATATELTLPYLVKLAVDRYIVVSAQMVKTDTVHSDELTEILNSYRHLFIDGGAGASFITAEKVLKIDPAELNRLKQAGIIREERFYLVAPENEKAWELAGTRKELFTIYPNLAVIKHSDVKNLDVDELYALRAQDLSGLMKLAILAALILISGFIFNFIHIFLLEYFGQRLTHDMRQELFSHLLKQNMAFHDENSTGRLVTRVTNDIQNLNEMIKSVAVTVFKDFFTLIGITAILISINLKLALFTFCLVPPIALLTIFFRSRARKVFRELRRRLAELNSMFAESISGIRVITAFNRQPFNRKTYENLNHLNYLAGMTQIRIFATFIPIIEFISVAGLALIVWYGGGSVFREVMTLGALVAFLSYVQRFFQPMRDLAEKFNILQSAMASLERIFQLLDSSEIIKESSAPLPVPDNIQGKIEFYEVEFAYKPDEPVLRNVSFSVEPGQTLAIVGATGAGKSSIINLLLRFYDVESGAVCVDGLDIRELELKSHRKRIGLVMQDVFIFAGTVRENLSMSNKGLSQKTIDDAAKAVNAFDFIQALPGGWDHMLDEGGLSLSAGQRQLISFARTLAQNPEILVLDEATSSIDSETEKLIDKALERLTSGRTSIIIAHRLSTIQKADKIIVLNRGKIVEEGTHEELLHKEGLYFSLHQLQFQSSISSGDFVSV